MYDADIAAALHGGRERAIDIFHLMDEVPLDRHTVVGLIYLSAVIVKIARNLPHAEEDFISLCRIVWRSTVVVRQVEHARA